LLALHMERKWYHRHFLGMDEVGDQLQWRITPQPPASRRKVEC
jgi:hypothetical protein